MNEITRYVGETENPDNVKGAVAVSVRVPELSRFRGVAVDPPLSQQDIGLIRTLLDYTPRVAVLLTKFDLLSQPEQSQVLEFVKTQLAREIGEKFEVHPYSTRAGYEHLHNAFEAELIDRLRSRIAGERAAVANRKLATLVRECGDYLRLTLKSAEMIESEKLQLRDRAVNERRAPADTKLELRLIARHAVAGCRSVIETALSKEEAAVRDEVRGSDRHCPKRRGSTKTSETKMTTPGPRSGHSPASPGRSYSAVLAAVPV